MGQPFSNMFQASTDQCACTTNAMEQHFPIPLILTVQADSV